MKKNQSIRFPLMIAGLLTVLSACQKNEPAFPVTPSVPSVSDIKEAASMVQSGNIFRFSDASANVNGKTLTWNAAVMNPCATYIFDTLLSPYRITIDYGKEPCLSPDGNSYSGMIEYSFTGPFLSEGSEHVYSTSSLIVNNVLYAGSKRLVNTGISDTKWGRYPVFQVRDDVQKSNLGTQEQHSYLTDNVYTIIGGSETADENDDEFMAEGMYRFGLPDGTMYEMETSRALQLYGDYIHPVSGILKLTRQNGNSVNIVLIDYGYPNGIRDNQALVTYSDGSTEVIELGLY